MEGHLFDSALATALQICRAAADHHLPIGEMLAHVDDAMEEDLIRESQGKSAVDLLTAPPSSTQVELQALGEIIAAVGAVASIGSRLPAPVEASQLEMPEPIRVPSPPAGGSSLILFAD